jgi:SET domain-containing protein
MHIRVGATNTGKGVFAAQDIQKGSIIIEMTGRHMGSEEVERAIEAGKIRPDDPFQIKEDEFIKLDRLPYLFNHSCEPNAGFKRGVVMVALRDIKKDEQICYDYSAVVCTHCEWEMHCMCGAKNCRKTVGNIKTVPHKTRLLYKNLRLLPRFVRIEV